MKYRAALFAMGFLLPGAGHASSCVVTPLEEHLAAADVVYVGTVASSRLMAPLDEMGSANPHHRPTVQHEVVPQIVLKGRAEAIPSVISGSGYIDPRRGRFWRGAALGKVSPGDTLLVAGKAGEPAYVGGCTASRSWDADTAEVVRAMFPGASE
jgi:hypothetical protein